MENADGIPYPIIFGKKDEKRISRSRGNTAGGESKSTTVTENKEYVYDPQIFTELLAGEFIGRATDVTLKTFKLRFNQYLAQEEKIHSQPFDFTMVENAYDKIINDIETIKHNL